MATVNVIIRKSYKAKDGSYPIVIRVEHARKQRLISVGYKVQEAFWKAGRVSSKHPDSSIINSAIASKEAMVKKYLADCQLHDKPIRLDLIGTGRQSYSFTEYLQHRARQYEAAGQPVMHDKVSRFVKELKAARGGEVYFDDVTLDFLRELDRYMIDQKNVQNTRHKKFKFLSEFYAHAIEEGKAPLPNPFHGYKINPTPVKKEKLTAAEIAAIENIPLNPGPVNDARNLFLFAFYCKGARFGNCIMLRWEHVRGGRVYIKASKGGKFLSTKIHTRLQAILDQYPKGEFVFPFVDHEPEEKRAYLKLVGKRNTVVNRNLKVVAGLTDPIITKELTFHISRHSFAYQLKQNTDNINIIQDSLGHADQRTTQIYVQALGDEILDKEMEKLYGR